MIDHISIRNFAIIENTEIDFEDGLNVITGETGAGKSIVIEAVSLALGSRADTSFVRHGSEKAIVQLAATIDDEEFIISREVSANGKNLCKLNGQLVTLGEISALAKTLADIHGQYDNQSLLDPAKHIELIDSFHQTEIIPVKETFKSAYESYKSARGKLEKLLATEQEAKRKKDFYEFEIAEIDNVSPVTGEDDELFDRISVLQNSEKIFDNIESAYALLDSGDENALMLLGNIQTSLQNIKDYSKELSDISTQTDETIYSLQEVSRALSGIRESLTFTPGELDSAIARLDSIENLKKKYGTSIEDVLAYRERISNELTQIENFDEIKAGLESQAKAALAILKDQTSKLTEVRKASAIELGRSIEKELSDLNFQKARISVDVKPAEAIGPDGGDYCEIMMTTNRGEPLKPLAKIASGGEISRIMLAIKNVTGRYDKIPTMIFDEIDAGISGVTASIVARKLKAISKGHQIICITHLPQIAAIGDTNYRIYKDSDESNTYTHVEKLNSDEKVEEIARLLGGDKITENTRKSAMELID